jgi:group I intron endonuclease
MYTIYLITNNVNGKVYVGQTKTKLYARWATHKRDARYGIDLCICRAIKKYGPESFSIKEIATADTQEWADYLARVWIVLHDSRNRKKGYNVRAGGIHSPGISPKGRLRLRKASTGRQPSEETKRLASARMKDGWKSGLYKGMPHTEESKEKMSLLRRGVNHNYYRKDISSVELVSLWNHGVENKTLSEYFGISRAMVYERIKKSGLEYRPFKRRLSKEQITTILSLVANGVSQKQIASQISCDPTTISHLLKKSKGRL